MTLAEILQMMRTPQSSGLGQVSNMEADAMKAAIEGAAVRGIPKFEGMGNVSDMEMQKLAQAMAVNPAQTMGSSPALSLPANEMQRNYADGQAPIAVGGGLLADEAQMLMNTAYDMSAPREMRINAINRLRELGY